MGYGLGKPGSCSAKRPKGAIDMALMKDWIAESYEAVAPKRKVEAKASGPHDRREVGAKRRR